MISKACWKRKRLWPRRSSPRCPGIWRERSPPSRDCARDAETGLRVAFFSASPYRNQLYRQKNVHGFALHFFPVPLSADTAPLATGFPVVVASANDCFDAEVIEALHELGVGMIALRCAGYNNVDLAACERFDISVARVPAYSPYAVALMMALNRRTHRAHIRIRDSNFSLDGLVGFDMHGKTAGVIGTGKIGACTLGILHGFGCHLLAHSRMPKQDLIHRLGGLIDTEALLEGLKTGRVGYAGLDVYEGEAKYFYRDFSDSLSTTTRWRA